MATLAATASFAQSSVTLYGNLDQSIFRAKSDAGFLLSSNSNAGSTSLWGITGSEDLGGGTKASFDLKSELTLLNGTTGSATTGVNTAGSSNAATPAPYESNANVFNRGANIAVANAGLGELKIGRQNDAWWETTTKFNNTGINSYGWANATAMVSGTNSLNLLYGGNPLTTVGGLVVSGASATAGVGANTGATNTGTVGTGGAFFGGLSYATPVVAGFQGKIAKGAPKAAYTQTGDANNIASYSLNYSNGPLTAAWARQNRTDAAAADALRQTMFAVKYVTGPYTLTYGNNAARVGGTAVSTDLAHNADVNAIGFGYTVNPSWTVDVGYTVVKDKDTTTNKWTQTGVVGKYALSKRTTWYVGYGRSANDGSARYGSIYGGSANAIPAVAGTNESNFITGLRHSF